MRRTVPGIITVLLLFALLGAVLVQTGHSSESPSPLQAKPLFVDMAGSTYRYDVEKLAALGIVRGYADGTFGPESGITRAEFAALIIRALGAEGQVASATGQPSFPDVTERHRWAYGYIKLATDLGIIKGYADGMFRPGDNVTNGEAITMIIRALGRDTQAESYVPFCSDSNDYTKPGLPDYVWPAGHIVLARTLGICNIGSAFDIATRGSVAAYLGDAIAIPIVTVDDDKAIHDTGRTFLSLQGAQSLRGRVTQVAPSATAQFLDVADGAGSAHHVALSPDTVMYGGIGTGGMVGRDVEIVAKGDAIRFVALERSLVGTVSASGESAGNLVLADGSTVRLSGDMVANRYTVNGWAADKGFVEQPWSEMLGDDPSEAGLRIVYDPLAEGKIERLETFRDLSGRLQWVDGRFRLAQPMVGDSYVYSYLEPDDPAGLIGPATTFSLNGRDATKAEVTAEVASLGPTWSAMAEIRIDPATRKASDIAVSAFDSADTYLQPLIALGADSITIPARGNAAGPARVYPVTPNAVISRNGSPIGLGELKPGDYVSFRTRDGAIAYLDSRPHPDYYTESSEGNHTNRSDVFHLTLVGAVDPATFTLSVDGEPYAPLMERPTGPVTTNSYWLYYHGDSEPGCRQETAQHVSVYRAGGFSEGVHSLEIVQHTYLQESIARNERRELVTDFSPPLIETVQYANNGLTITLELAESIGHYSDWDLAGDASGIESIAWNGDRVLVIRLREPRPGAVFSVIVADLAGNQAPISVTLPR